VGRMVGKSWYCEDGRPGRPGDFWGWMETGGGGGGGLGGEEVGGAGGGG